MSILIIGQSSFLAREVKKLDISSDWNFIGHQDAFEKDKWPQDTQTVINFACDPKVKNGEFSDFDHKIAEMAKEADAAYIMLSSRAAYGISPTPTQFVENQEVCKTIAPYGAAKRQIEDDLLEHFDHVTILRLSNIFGLEYGTDQGRQTFFGIMLKSLREEGQIRFSMNRMTQRDFLPIPIFAAYLAVIANAPKAGIYNLGSGVGTSVGDLANWVIEGYGKGQIAHADAEIVDSFILDMNKTRSTYGLPVVSTDLIRKSCLDIGCALKDA